MIVIQCWKMVPNASLNLNDEDLIWIEWLGGNGYIRINVIHHGLSWITMNWIELNDLVGTHSKNEARPGGNTTQYRRRVTRMRLLKTISALISVNVSRKQRGLFICWPDKLISPVYQRYKTRVRTKDRSLKDREIGAFVKSDMLHSLYARWASS